jgi:hypothetical protein
VEIPVPVLKLLPDVSVATPSLITITTLEGVDGCALPVWLGCSGCVTVNELRHSLSQRPQSE